MKIKQLQSQVNKYLIWAFFRNIFALGGKPANPVITALHSYLKGSADTEAEFDYYEFYVSLPHKLQLAADSSIDKRIRSEQQILRSIRTYRTLARTSVRLVASQSEAWQIRASTAHVERGGESLVRTSSDNLTVQTQMRPHLVVGSGTLSMGSKSLISPALPIVQPTQTLTFYTPNPYSLTAYQSVDSPSLPESIIPTTLRQMASYPTGSHCLPFSAAAQATKCCNFFFRDHPEAKASLEKTQEAQQQHIRSTQAKSLAKPK